MKKIGLALLVCGIVGCIAETETSGEAEEGITGIERGITPVRSVRDEREEGSISLGDALAGVSAVDPSAPAVCHTAFATGLPHVNICSCQAYSADPTIISCIPWDNCDCSLGGLCSAPDANGCASCAAICPSGCWARFPTPPATCNCLAASECQ